jgi:hypothetical protein
MSLDDAYLRDQLRAFRHQIRRNFWFQGQAPAQPMARWAYANDISVVVTGWPEFWATVSAEMVEPQERQLRRAWWDLLDSADASLGAPITDSLNSLLHAFDKNPGSYASWVQKAVIAGEDVHIDPGPRKPPSEFAMDTADERLRYESAWADEDRRASSG